MGRKSKYKPRFAKELKGYTKIVDGKMVKVEGIRRNLDIYHGREYLCSIERICWKWDITPKTYYNWVDEFTSFREAHEVGERDFRICIQELLEDGMREGKSFNSIIARYRINNSDAGMSDKKEITQTIQESKIHRIEIEVLTPQPVALPEPTTVPNNIIDITPINEHNKVKSS